MNERTPTRIGWGSSRVSNDYFLLFTGQGPTPSLTKDV